MEEIWIRIPSCDGYEASSLGRVRSVDRTVIDNTEEIESECGDLRAENASLGLDRHLGECVQERDALRAENADLREENDDYAERVRRLRDNTEEIESECGDLRAENASLKAEVERLREQLRLLNIDAANLFAEATDAKAEVDRLKADGERLLFALSAAGDAYSSLCDRSHIGNDDHREIAALQAILDAIDLARKAQGGE